MHQPFADADPNDLRAVFGRLDQLTKEQGNAVVVADVVARLRAKAALPDLRAFADKWRPDLIMREPAEVGSYVVAEAAGIRHVEVATYLTSFQDRFVPILERPLRELGCTTGAERLRSMPRLSLLPESFEDPAHTGSERTRRFRAPEPST